MLPFSWSTPGDMVYCVCGTSNNSPIFSVNREKRERNERETTGRRSYTHREASPTRSERIIILQCGWLHEAVAIVSVKSLQLLVDGVGQALCHHTQNFKKFFIFRSIHNIHCRLDRKSLARGRNTA